MPSHTHPNVTVNSSIVSHTHPMVTAYVDCGVGDVHAHGCSVSSTDPHSHSNCVLAFGPSSLGSPSWWMHRHPVTLLSMDSAGSSHTHTITSIRDDGCLLCLEYGWPFHSHSIGTASLLTGGAPHTHGIPTVYTGYADPSGTPENHTHPFSFATSEGGSHSHAASGYTGYAYCGGGYNHRHGVTGASSAGHTHTLSGNTPPGGEIPVLAVRHLTGDGFVMVIT